MGWSIRDASGEESIHSLVYRIMEEADSLKGEDHAQYTGKYLYRSLERDRALCAFAEGEKEPQGLMLFSGEELKFLFVLPGEFQEEIARSLFEHATHRDEGKESGCALFSDFSAWKDVIGQDLMSPLLKELRYHELQLIKMSVSLDSQTLAGYLSCDFMEHLRASGYSLAGWKEQEHLDALLELLLQAPPQKVAALKAAGGSDAEMKELLMKEILTGEVGQEYSYPAECSSVVIHRETGKVAGVLLCEERGWINRIVVSSGHQKKGIARAMMQKAYRALKVLEAASMGLIVYEENQPAFQWYGKMGFEPVSRHSQWLRNICGPAWEGKQE